MSYSVSTDQGYVFRYAHADHEIVLIAWSLQIQFEDLLQMMHNAIDHTLGTRLHIGYSTAHPLEALTKGYQQARAAIKHYNIKEPRSFLHHANETQQEQGSWVLFEEQKESLHIAIRSGALDKLTLAIAQANLLIQLVI